MHVPNEPTKEHTRFGHQPFAHEPIEQRRTDPDQCCGLFAVDPDRRKIVGKDSGRALHDTLPIDFSVASASNAGYFQISRSAAIWWA